MGSEWIECTLADVCSSIDYGLTASATVHKTGLKFLRITDIVTGHIDWNNVPYVDADSRAAEKYRLYNGDIVIARTGASTGSSIYIMDPPTAVFASYLVRLKIKSEFDPRYVGYYLRSDQFWTFIQGVLGDKSAQPNASASTMTSAPFRAPKNKDEQRAIAYILGTLDDKIELNHRMNQTLEAMARAIFKSWFVDFDPVRAKAEGKELFGMDPEMAALFPDDLNLIDGKEVPIGWEILNVKSVANINQNTLKKSDSIKWIQYIEISEVNSGDIITLSEYKRGSEPSRARRRLSHGDTALSTVRPERKSYFLCINPPENLIASTGFAVVTPKSVPWGFLHAFLTQPKIFEYLGHIADGGAYPAIRSDIIGEMEICLPNDSRILSSFQNIVSSIYEMADNNRKHSHTIALLRDNLLPKLISGDMRIQDAEKFVEEARVI